MIGKKTILASNTALSFPCYTNDTKDKHYTRGLMPRHCRAWLFGSHVPADVYSGFGFTNGASHNQESDNIIDDKIIAVDSGLDFLRSKSIKPDLILGDFDSLQEPSILSEYPSSIILQFPQAKNETDMELAVKWCISNKIKEIVICNDMKGRLDHTLGLIQNLILATKAAIPARIETGSQVVFFLDNITQLSFPSASLLSIIPYSRNVSFTKSTGLQYPLDGISISIHSSRAISNVIIDPGAVINKKNGLALAIITPVCIIHSICNTD